MSYLTAQKIYYNQVSPEYFEDIEESLIQHYGSKESEVRKVYCIEEQQCDTYKHCVENCDSCQGLRNILEEI